MTEFILADTYDGPIHRLKEIYVKKNMKYPTVKCGAELAPRHPSEDGSDWTAWHSLATCKDCLKG